ncbi:MAG: SDR family NAD(P)-dependent oxidoreductase [Calditrichaeota bacterium]|nr:MAG: SDR family NAD(P)-dependent oxidoreductase [Calditrichota bacterium]
MNNNKRILITGGAGFIGSHLADKLLENGYSVSVIDDLSTGSIQNLQQASPSPYFQFIEGDVGDYEQVFELINEADVVFHLAAAVGVDYILKNRVESIERCLQGTKTVLEIASRLQKKVIFTSTSEVYGQNNQLPFVETGQLVIGSPQTFRWSYACAKAMDEFMALAYYKEQGLDVVITRLFNTVGPRQSAKYGMVLPRFLHQASKNEPLTVFGDGSQTRCFCDIDDVTRALMALINCTAAVGEIVNIGSAEEVTIDELAQRIIIQSGSLSDIENIPVHEARGEGFDDMQRRVPDLQKIKNLIGWQPQHNLASIIENLVRKIGVAENEVRLPEAIKLVK